MFPYSLENKREDVSRSIFTSGVIFFLKMALSMNLLFKSFNFIIKTFCFQIISMTFDSYLHKYILFIPEMVVVYRHQWISWMMSTFFIICSSYFYSSSSFSSSSSFLLRFILPSSHTCVRSDHFITISSSPHTLPTIYVFIN